ncbi:MAG TPA: aminotransferase class III-fold pyridoxal phosphate-dependent enzyme [Planctomycetota bacterium]|nr:aminotransferase class III-fold pyridoxal phosphate-dependent enzyme [Planctomycetota bacterium]
MKAPEAAVASPAVSTEPSRPAVRRDAVAEAQAVLEKEFVRRCPQSAMLYQRAAALFPGGVTHDNRRLSGPSLFVRSARGARKIDTDGHSYIDYWVGHGALLLGHGRREVVEAIHLAAQDITHPGACHEREVLWAEQIRELMPNAERIRFTASGSESSALAVRLARAMTGKSVIVKFEGHFHGWLDHAVEGVDLPFDTPFSAGVPGVVRHQTLVLPARDLDRVAEVLDENDDIAAIILEPTGASGGSVPIRPDFLRGLRQLTSQHGVALIFDEVITGFRLAPGGAQARFGVAPDITCLAKIVAGGMPGGAVVGTRDAFKAMEFSGDAKKDRKRVTQYGTFNASPVCAAAGKATLGLIGDGEPCRKAEAFAGKLRHGLNTLFRSEDLPWAAYGVSSVFHILTSDAECGLPMRDGKLDAADVDPVILKQKGGVDAVLRRALQLEGVDLPPGRQAWISAAHGPAELEETLDAFSRAIHRLRSLRCI